MLQEKCVIIVKNKEIEVKKLKTVKKLKIVSLKIFHVSAGNFGKKVLKNSREGCFCIRSWSFCKKCECGYKCCILELSNA